MAVVQRLTWKVRPGRTQEFLANAATGRKILERLGAKVRVLNEVVGRDAPCSLVVVESPNWKAFWLAIGEDADRLGVAGLLRKGRLEQCWHLYRPFDGFVH
jgi:hypothetical protein